MVYFFQVSCMWVNFMTVCFQVLCMWVYVLRVLFERLSRGSIVYCLFFKSYSCGTIFWHFAFKSYLCGLCVVCALCRVFGLCICGVPILSLGLAGINISVQRLFNPWEAYFGRPPGLGSSHLWGADYGRPRCGFLFEPCGASFGHPSPSPLETILGKQVSLLRVLESLTQGIPGSLAALGTWLVRYTCYGLRPLPPAPLDD